MSQRGGAPSLTPFHPPETTLNNKIYFNTYLRRWLPITENAGNTADDWFETFKSQGICVGTIKK